jgi:hypothetical protein
MKTLSNFSQAEPLIEERFKYFDKTEQFDLSEIFLQHGFILPKPEGFNLPNFGKKITEKIKASEFSDAEVESYESNTLSLKFSKKRFWGFGKKKDTFFLAVVEDYLVFAFKSSIKKSGLLSFSKSKPQKFLEHFYGKLKEEQDLLNPENKSAGDNVLIRKTNTFKELSVRFLLAENEMLLAVLPVEKLKGDEDLEGNKLSRFRYILSDKDAGVAGFDSSGRLVFLKKIGDAKMKMKGFWLWKTIKFDTYRMVPGKGSLKSFKRILHLNTADSETRIKEVVSINYEKGAFSVADRMMRLLAEKTGDPFYELSRLFAEFISRKALFADADVRTRFITHMRNAMSGLMGIEKYKFFLTNYKLSHKDRAIFLQLMLKAGTNTDQFTNGLPVAEFIHNDFQKKCKSPERKLIVNILFAKYLILAKENKDAEKLIKKIRKQLPEEELTLLMPENKTDLTEAEAGKYLLTEIYDMLSELNPKEETYYAYKQAEIQPLNSDRLKKLAESDHKKSKEAQHILALLKSETISGETAQPLPAQYKPIKSLAIFGQLKHPAERSKGSMQYVEKWLKNNDKANYSNVKSFAKQLKSEDYPEISETIRSLATALALGDIEIYIAEGKMAGQLVGYADKPPFLVIGSDLLNAPLGDIAFLAARQLAHITFGHSPVSSKAVWQTFAVEGQIALDALTKTITTAGLYGKGLKEIQTVNEITHTLKQINFNDRTEGTFESAAANLYQFLYKPLKFSNYAKDNNRLVLAGRLLQASADRAGLLFAPNLHTAFNAAVKYALPENADKDENITLSGILHAKNNDGTYRYPELTVRILNMFSFYLSENYSDLQKAVRK